MSTWFIQHNQWSIIFRNAKSERKSSSVEAIPISTYISFWFCCELNITLKHRLLDQLYHTKFAWSKSLFTSAEHYEFGIMEIFYNINVYKSAFIFQNVCKSIYSIGIKITINKLYLTKVIFKCISTVALGRLGLRMLFIYNKSH